MGKTTKNIKTASRVTKNTGRAASKATRATATRWRGLLPLLCMAAAGIYAAVTHLMTWAIASWEAWALMISIGATLFVWADGWVGQMHITHRRPAAAFVLYTLAAAVLLIVVPHILAVYVLMLVAALVIGTWWWNGDAYKSFKLREQMQRRMERILAKLGSGDDTRITSVKQNAKGDIEWRLYLGDSDRPDQIKAADVAHLLKCETSRVIVRRVDGDSTRHVKVVVLAKALRKPERVTHPAAEKAAREAGPWAPNARRVAQGAPIGPFADDVDTQAVFRVYEDDHGARHNLIAGATGSGKSVTISSIMAHCVASNDCVVAGVDLMKGGETFMPWDDAGVMASHLYLTADQANDTKALLAAGKTLLQELTWLRQEVARRTADMASGRVRDADGERTRNWPASPQNPVLVYFFEEYATTISALSALDDDLAAQIDDTLSDCSKAARSSGISFNIVTQRAATDELPAALRAQLSQTILHKLTAANDKGRLWQEYDVDPIRTLAAGKGLCYVDQPGGVDPALVKAYDLSKPRVCTEIGAAYAHTRPVIGWAGQAPTAPQATESAPADASELLADAFDGDIPDDAPLITGTDDSVTAADERAAAVIQALADASEPLSRAQVQAVADLGMTVTKNVLTALIDSGQVSREGTGRATKYRLARQLADA